MDSNQQKHMIAALDIGSSKVTCAIAEIDQDGVTKLAGYGKVPASGIRQGCISNVAQAMDCIRRAIEEAEVISQRKVSGIAVALSGKHLHSVNKTAQRVLRDSEVRLRDVKEARALAVTYDRKSDGGNADDRCVAYLLKGFTLGTDDTVIEDPTGMECRGTLKAHAHLAIGSDTIILNLLKCIRKINVTPESLVLQPWASAECTLTKNERKNGVVLLDFGAGTIDVACYKEGVIEETLVIPLGGDIMTQDIASFLRCTPEDAEEIKLHHGHIGLRAEDAHTDIHYKEEVSGTEQVIQATELESLLSLRLREILSYVYKIVFDEKKWVEKAGTGVVIVGGVSVMPGLKEAAEEVFHLPVRIGRPRPMGNYLLEPSDCTVIGVLMDVERRMRQHNKKIVRVGPFTGIMGAVKRFFVGDYA